LHLEIQYRHYIAPGEITKVTKIALHRTRLRLLRQLIFSVSFFYKPIRQATPFLGFCDKYQTEKCEKDFSLFQFRLSGNLAKPDVTTCLN